MPPFADSQVQDPIIMAGYDDDDSSFVNDDDIRVFHKRKHNENHDHDNTTKKETSNVVLSFYDVLMDFNLPCCSTSYKEKEMSLPNKKGNTIEGVDNRNMSPFAESQEQDPIIMVGYDDENSSLTDDELRCSNKPKQNGNTDNHDVTTKKETSKVVLSFYNVVMDFNLCCNTLHDDETVVAGSKSRTSYEQVEYSVPNENGNTIQEEENNKKEENRQEKVLSNNNNTTMGYEKKKKQFSIVLDRFHKSMSMKKVNSSSRSTTSTGWSSSNQKEKKPTRTSRIQRSISLNKIKRIWKTMSTASLPTNMKKKEKKKTASVLMTNGTFSFQKLNRNRNNKNESQDSDNSAGLSSFVQQMNRMGYPSATKQNHSYYEIRTK